MNYTNGGEQFGDAALSLVGDAPGIPNAITQTTRLNHWVEEGMMEFPDDFGGVIPSAGIPVNNANGDQFTVAALGNELMTPLGENGASTPLSAITAAMLDDLGYDIDYTYCERYNLGDGGAGFGL